jgi:hypothetical protein
VKPVLEPVPTPKVRPKSLEPVELGRVLSKDPARDQARRLARDKDIKPTRSSPSSVPATSDEPVPKRKPSRTGRSMKSRQSNPRASKTGRTNSSTRKQVKPPVVLMAVAAVAVVLGLIMVPRLFQSSPRRVTQVNYAATNGFNAGAATLPAVNVQTSATSHLSIGRTITTSSSQSQKPAVNLTPSEQIQLEQIAGYESGIPPVIVFRDGSKLNADPVVIGRLRADVRMQLTYSREPQ